MSPFYPQNTVAAYPERGIIPSKLSGFQTASGCKNNRKVRWDMRSTQVRRFCFSAIVLTMLLLAGCGQSKKFTPEDFKKVSPGMSVEQVTQILGSPKETL